MSWACAPRAATFWSWTSAGSRRDAVVYVSDDIRTFRRTTSSWAWGSYTAVYLGVAGAAYGELVRVVSARQVPGYTQPLAYHPDVRRQVAQLSAELEAARLLTYRSAWLYETEGPTEETTAALFRAKYVVGEAVAHIARGGPDPLGLPRHFQGWAHRAALSRWGFGPASRAAIRFLSLEHGDS